MTWTTAFINNLPDSSFAYIEPGGSKDADGKTTPRSKRHLPFKDSSGKVDSAHLRNALSRLPQTQISSGAKASALTKLRAASKGAGVKASDSQEAMRDIFAGALREQPEVLSLLEVYIDALPATMDGDMSFESIIRAAQDACRAYADENHPNISGDSPMYGSDHQVIATFPDSVVYTCDGKLYQADYKVNGTDVEIDGEPQEVTAQFAAAAKQAQESLQESVDLIEARPSGSIKLGKINRALNIIEGTTLIGPLSSNGLNKKRRYSEAALKKIASMAEGLPGYFNHVKPEDAFKPRDVRDIAVRHRNVRFDPGTQTVRSDMHVAPHHAETVFGLAETFGDHIGNSLVSKGAVTMEGDTEVVQDILALRSADLVSDPASTKGLFEGAETRERPLTIVDLIESLKTQPKEETVDIAAILTHLKDKPEEQRLLAEHFGFVIKTDAAKLTESIASLTTERDTLKATAVKTDATLAEKDKTLAETVKTLGEAKVELDGFKAKDAVAAKRIKLAEAVAAHPLQKDFGSVKGAISEDFKTLLEGMDEASWKKMLDDRHAALKSVPRGQSPRSDLKDLREHSDNGGMPEGIHARVAGMFNRN